MHTMRIAFALLLVAMAVSGLAQTQAPGHKKDIKITWLGHSAFEIVSPGGTDIMIDPFLTKNPATPTELKDLTHYHPAYVLVTHSHGDHIGDAIELAKIDPTGARSGSLGHRLDTGPEKTRASARHNKRRKMEQKGFEPSTPTLRTWCSPS